MLDAAAGVGAARRGERVDLVEDDDRRRGLAGAVEDLPQTFFALADPAALQLRPGDNGDRRPQRGGHRLGEERLAGAGRAPEDHAARDQLLGPGDLGGVGGLVLVSQYVQDLALQPFLDPAVAANVAAPVDLRHL